MFQSLLSTWLPAGPATPFWAAVTSAGVRPALLTVEAVSSVLPMMATSPGALAEKRGVNGVTTTGTMRSWRRSSEGKARAARRGHLPRAPRTRRRRLFGANHLAIEERAMTRSPVAKTCEEGQTVQVLQ